MYRPGYRFHVSAKYEDGKLKSLPVLYARRFCSRGDAAPTVLLKDGELVEVLAYIHGAVVVFVPRTNDVGWLG